MKLTPHAQKLADEWLAEGYNDLDELAEILGIARGGIGAEAQGHCYRRINDDEFAPADLEDLIDDDDRLAQLIDGTATVTEEEMEIWRQAQREAQDATRFFIWKVPFTREELYMITIHRKNGYLDRADGLFHSAEATEPYGDVVYDG